MHGYHFSLGDFDDTDYTPSQVYILNVSIVYVYYQECTPGIMYIQDVANLFVFLLIVRHFWALANLQRPQVSMLSTHVHTEKAYVGIECSEEVVLANDSPVPAQFTWSSRVAGEGVRVVVDPMTGRIGPHQTITIGIKVTWTEIVTIFTTYNNYVFTIISTFYMFDSICIYRNPMLKLYCVVKSLIWRNLSSSCSLHKFLVSQYRLVIH